MNAADVDRVVEKIIVDLLKRIGKPTVIGGGARLDVAGLTSQDGVELACDLESRLSIQIADSMNPLVHESNARMRTLAELQTWARQQVIAKEGVR